MPEKQNVEYKSIWKDEYLKWICGFANAQGGKILIGKDDLGNTIGIDDYKKLLETLPNKIKDKLHILPDINLLEDNGNKYLQIVIVPSNQPVSYEGVFYYRSGSTLQELNGLALSEFITRKTGVRWEDAIVDNLTVDDLDDESFKIFRREALKSKRMSEEELNVSNEELLSKLHLLRDGKLKRSAVLLFHKDPQTVQNGSYVKVGKFEGPEVVYHDLFEGSLIETADKIVDVIFLKYLKAKITYVNNRRTETYPYSKDALREAIYNAIAHNCYMFGVPIQIRINEEDIYISNQCILPEGWTVDSFMQVHDSMPYNPDIAGVFFRAGWIEAWGKGIEKICNACESIGADLPEYNLTGHSLRVKIKGLKSALLDLKVPKGQSEPLDEPLENLLENRIVQAIKENPRITYDGLALLLAVSRSTVKRTIAKLVFEGRIERIGGKRYGHWQARN